MEDKPLVLVGVKLPPDALEALEEHLRVESWEKVKDRPELLAEAFGCVSFAGSLDLLDQMPKLRVISSPWTGYDQFDVPDLTRRGILLMTAPEALTETVADLAFGLILAAARRIAELDAFVRKGGWKPGVVEELYGTDVHGKILGITGMGRIGAAIAKRGALGFGMPVLYTSRSPKPEVERAYIAKRCKIDELMENSDFVCNILPYSSETHEIIGARQIALMKPSAIFVNVGRGKTVDEASLITALESGALRGAGLDVFEEEPLPLDSPLLKLPNVVLMPHIGSAVAETREAMFRLAADNLIGFLLNGQAKSAINPEALR